MTEPAAASAAAADDIRIVGGSPSDDEIAAITAVLHDLASSVDDHPVVETAPESAWQRDRRPIRGAVSRGPGAWRGFH
ncbi:acyl-CoA carboxylase subunit epsilon [Marisediminicola senii]|uniref:acyl-CoA carboxylase subunit epsilon n=1 Tax=Marisediminicola senii TaxID=2711233 RepID=UPI0013EAEEBB|nr:acyl-CoA carboxylase subunit epsilon [Marisediminicola senii]